MIDIWLIFAMVIPFFEVLLHTYMESLNDDEDRTINHHGVAMDVAEKGGGNKVQQSELQNYNFSYFRILFRLPLLQKTLLPGRT